MRPAVGVVTEMVALTLILGASTAIPRGLAFGLYVAICGFLAAYLVHCPAHYVVGTLVGIRFRRMSLGRTALSQALPRRLSPVAKLMPVFTLTTAKESLLGVSNGRLALMYGSGVVMSVTAAVAVAVVATLEEPLVYAALAWIVAAAYLGFDAVFSPKSGDLARAKVALTRGLREPIQP